jgi:hypothetical protein
MPYRLLTAHAMPDRAPPSQATPRHAAPRLAAPCPTKRQLLPPEAALFPMRYRLFTAHAPPRRAMPYQAVPVLALPCQALEIYYRSALFAMPDRAATFATASTFTRR